MKIEGDNEQDSLLEKIHYPIEVMTMNIKDKEDETSIKLISKEEKT